MYRKMLLIGVMFVLAGIVLGDTYYSKSKPLYDDEDKSSHLEQYFQVQISDEIAKENEVNALGTEPQLEEYDALLSDGETRINTYLPQNMNTMFRGMATADTMAYCASSGGQFIMDAGDVMVSFYQMPADGDITGVNIPVFQWAEDTLTDKLDVSIWSVTYPNGTDGNPYDAGAVDGAGWLGYGWDGCDHGSPDPHEGDWYGDDADELGMCGGKVPNENAQDPLDARLWPTGFANEQFGHATVGAQGDNWIDITGGPSLAQGDWFAVVVENVSGSTGAASTIGFYYCEGDGLVDTWVGAKYYGTECGGTSSEAGWHIRHWIFDYPVAVSLTGDRGPVISDVTELPTTLSTDDRAVSAVITDDNPAGGDAGVASATLSYSTDGTTYTDVTMTAVVDTFSAAIPGQAAGSSVSWYIKAVDVAGAEAKTSESSYSVFLNSSTNLFVYNSSNFGTWIAGYYLYAADTTFGQTADVWSYGKAGAELFANYNTIVEISGGGPDWCNDTTALAAWLDTGNKNYISAGDEWMGACVDGWAATTFAAGEFVYDYLGMAASIPDFNYGASGDQGGISRLMAVEGDAISGALYTWLADNSGSTADSTLYLNYDPDYEIGASNWLDGADAVAGTNVSFTGYGGVLDADGNVDSTALADAVIHSTGLYTELANGSKTAWFGFDVLSLNTSPAYSWIGVGDVGPLPQALSWMGHGDSGSMGGGTDAPSWPAEPEPDCAGVIGGDAVEDCLGDCNGTAVLDSCGNCGGDCVAEVDECGVILAVTCGDSELNTVVADECGVCGGEGVLDECGVCDGEGVLDECGVCDGEGTAEGFDCDGNELSIYDGVIPDTYSIQNIYPNPFNPITNIKYGLPENADVRISVYDITGRYIQTLIHSFQLAGYHTIQWDASSQPSGVYLINVTSGSFNKTNKIILMK